MAKTTDLVAAMRSSSQAPTSSPPCTTCAYRVVELLDGKEYTGCDCDRMGMDAADKIEELVERCARYAEEIAVLREEANKDERVVVLPCKVGQRVFALLDTDKHISECEVKQIVLGNEIGFVGLEPVGARGREYGVSIKGFGKTVFLTREEAEKALEAMRKEEAARWTASKSSCS